MHQIVLIQAVTTLVYAVFGLAGHYVGDHWVQTNFQACEKALDRPGCRTLIALFACAKHVIGWSTTVAVCIVGASWWLGLPIRPAWFAAGMAINAITHFVADLRTPLIWLGRKLGRGGYIDHVQVHRGKVVERTGPGTALFHASSSTIGGHGRPRRRMDRPARRAPRAHRGARRAAVSVETGPEVALQLVDPQQATSA